MAAYLEGNLERNGIQGVTLHRAATWISEGTLRFASEGADGGRLDANAGGVEVPTVNLRTLIEQQTRIDFLKMDIEGAEAELVPHLGESLRRIRHLFIEYHSYAGQNQALHPILNTLAAEGFRYYIETDVKRKNPFTAPPEFQCNIFASREA